MYSWHFITADAEKAFINNLPEDFDWEIDSEESSAPEDVPQHKQHSGYASQLYGSTQQPPQQIYGTTYASTVQRVPVYGGNPNSNPNLQPYGSTLTPPSMAQRVPVYGGNLQQPYGSTYILTPPSMAQRVPVYGGNPSPILQQPYGSTYTSVAQGVPIYGGNPNPNPLSMQRVPVYSGNLNHNPNRAPHFHSYLHQPFWQSQQGGESEGEPFNSNYDSPGTLKGDDMEDEEEL